MSSYRTATLDEIAAEKWPTWIPVRHYFGIDAFGVNAYRVDQGASAVPEHDESDSGHVELYYVASGGARFTIGGEDVEAQAGTFLYVDDPATKRAAVATADGTVVLAMGAPRGRAYEVRGWDTQYLEGGAE
ncbi:MAG TPA: cupin domain-containing protein [Gaiellaceae bacterium]|nr:cupin domain-containing protein [Gaiellaceae bacterium]